MIDPELSNRFLSLFEGLFKQAFKSQLAQPPDPNKNLQVSNGECRQRLHYGSDFKDLLDARDQVLEHSFDFLVPFDIQEVRNNGGALTGTELHNSIYTKMRKFLVEAISNVASVSFRFLNEDKLTEKEAKQYASKNILLNVNSVFRQMCSAISANERLKSVISEGKLEDFRLRLLKEADSILESILSNLADSYPMAAVTGGSQKMRANVQEINRTENQEYDLIFANNISIKEHIKQNNKDYTKYIMEVINAAVRATQACEQDSRDRTYIQIFEQFNQKLEWAAQNDKFQDLLAYTENDGQNYAENFAQREKAANTILQFFSETLETNNDSLKDLKQKCYSIGKSKIYRLQNIDTIDNLFKQLLQKHQDPIKGVGLQSKKLMLGQKIPAYVKQYSKLEIDGKKFTARHSSVLRIMSKWMEYLENLFKNAEKLYTNRTYPFKTIDNRLVTLWNGEGRGIPKLIQQLNSEYEEVKKQFQKIRQNNFLFLSQLLSKQEQGETNVGRYSQSRSVASKANAVLTNLMLQYLNTLIHHLLKAGRGLETFQADVELNLVVFRVSDLMRSKIQCSEASFVSILKTFYLFDGHQDAEKKVKIVRIKNRLDSSANDIMINYMFMGKVQCELQLSIQESKGKEKHYYTFSHFFYQLTRGKFGVITELAIMISQLDPMITACNGNYYTEKKDATLLSRKQKKNDQQNNQVKLKISDSTYECTKCKRLVIGEAIDIFEKKQNQKYVCNRCVIKCDNPEEKVRKQSLQKALVSLKGKKQASLKISKMQDKKYLLILDEQGTLSLNIIIYVEKELKTFLLQIRSNTVLTNDFSLNQLGYFDVKNLPKDSGKQNPVSIKYLVDNSDSIPDAIYQHIQVDKYNLKDDKKQSVIKRFKQLREEKNMVKAIKFKEQIIKCDCREKWLTMDNVVSKLVLKPDKNSEQKAITLHYTKYRHLDITNLKQIIAQRCIVKTMPRWLSQCRGLTRLDMSANEIVKVAKEQLPPSLHELILQRNKLQEIDLKGLLSLKLLNVSSNKLPKLEVNSLEHLIQLHAYCNQLEQIDVSKMPNLTSLRLHQNKLKSINLKNPTNLKSLFLNNNKFESIVLPDTALSLIQIHLSHNHLKQFVLPKYPQLKELQIDNNNLSIIDVKQATQLKTLKMKGNPIKHMEFLPQSLEQLYAEKEVYASYDREKLPNLKKVE